MKYTGEKCFYCENTFTDGDDIVVCPDCGTPYHRDCYKEAGSCTNKQLHDSGESWKKEEKSVSSVIVRCPACASLNSADAETCSACGYNISGSEESSEDKDTHEQTQFQSVFDTIDVNKQYLGFNPDEDFGGAKLKEIAQFVDSNTLYYIPIFKRMKDLGSKLSFNIICLFFPYFYFANRKMWFWAIFTALISTLLNIPEFIYFVGIQSSALPIMEDAANFINSNESFITAINDICSMAEWIMRIATCMFGNWLYYRFSIRSINKLKAHYGGPVSPQCLSSKGGVAPVNLLLMGVILLALTAAFYFVITFIAVYLQQSGFLA